MLFSKISDFINKGDSRSVLYKKNTIYMFLLKGISMIISFLYVPLLLNSLDTENYAIWLTLTSIVAWVAMMDIGLGNGLRNKLTESLANNDILLARKYISSAYVALFMYILFFLIIFIFAIYRFVPWNVVLNAPNVLEKNLDTLVLVVFFSFGIQFVLNLVNSILLALQRPAISSLLSTLGQLLSFIIVFICVKFLHINSLLFLGCVVSLAPVIVLLFASIVLFLGKYKELSPSIRYYDSSLIKNIIKLGVLFFIIQIITIVLYQSNNIILTHVVGNEGVVEYNVAYKYFQILYMLYMIIVTPVWSAATQAYAVQDFKWINNAKNKLKRIALLFSLLGCLMLIASPLVYKVWIGKEHINIMFSTSLLLLISEIFRMFYGYYGYIINGIGKLYAQLVITGVMTILYIPVTILIAKLWGLAGLLIMNIIVNLINFIWSRYQYNLLMNKRATGIWIK